jgi:hypothetical protein
LKRHRCHWWQRHVWLLASVSEGWAHRNVLRTLATSVCENCDKIKQETFDGHILQALCKHRRLASELTTNRGVPYSE